MKEARYKRTYILYDSDLYELSRIGKSTDAESRLSFARPVVGGKNGEQLLNGGGVFCLGDENGLELDGCTML